MESANRWGLVALIGLSLVILLLYFPFLDHPFQYDDEHTIAANPALNQTDAWWAAFAGTMPSSGEGMGNHYRPLTYMTYWITLRAAGTTPVAFHAFNLVLHLMAVWLLFYLIREVMGDRRVALLAAALFGLHPAISEAVLYASARATILSSLCMLAALVCYVRARRQQGAGQSSSIWWVGWAVAGLAALLAKETGVALPLLCLATDYLIAHRGDGTTGDRITGWRRWAPHLAAFGVLAAFAIRVGLARHATSALATPDAVAEYLGVIAGQLGAVAMAMRLFVIPWPLTVDHPLAAWPQPAAVLSAMLIVAWCTVGVVAMASRTLLINRTGFLALWVMIVALPTTLWPLNVPFQEHRAYLQHAGLAALTALAVFALIEAQPARRTAARTLAIVVGGAWLLASGWLIIDQGRRWSDSVQLWEHARVHAPASFRAQTNVGLALAAAGRWDDARTALAVALSLNPDYPPALVARGADAHRRGDRAAARADYEHAARLKPDYVPALYNLGLSFQESNDPVAAEQWYRRALTINPRHRDSLLNLGVLLLAQGRTAEAVDTLDAARAITPDAPEVLYSSGAAAERQGRVTDARAYFLRAHQTALASGRTDLARDAETRLTALDRAASSR